MLTTAPLCMPGDALTATDPPPRPCQRRPLLTHRAEDY